MATLVKVNQSIIQCGSYASYTNIALALAYIYVAMAGQREISILAYLQPLLNATQQ
jgi:hypothetical protein